MKQFTIQKRRIKFIIDLQIEMKIFPLFVDDFQNYDHVSCVEIKILRRTTNRVTPTNTTNWCGNVQNLMHPSMVHPLKRKQELFVTHRN